MTSAESLKAIKAAAPAGAAAFAIVAALVVGSIMSPRPTPPGALPLAATPQPDAAVAAVDGSSATTQVTPPEPGSSVPGVQFDQGAPAAAPNQAIEIVVKFKDDKKVKDIVDTFWKNAPAAKAKFEAFKRGRPEMADTVLDRVTYSNELVLVHKGGAVPPAQRLTAMRDIAKRLGAASDISYAEPNMTAHPGGQ
jgi:hypothetical protein